MVRKTFCDRCGKEIPKDLDNEISFTRVRRTRFGIDKQIHICDNCLNKFWEWLDKKNKKE